jgi:hypothetical protein
MYFSLGLLYVAAVLEKAGHKVQIADLRDGNGFIPHLNYGRFLGECLSSIRAQGRNRRRSSSYPPKELRGLPLPPRNELAW